MVFFLIHLLILHLLFIFKRVSNDSRESGKDVCISGLNALIRRSECLKWLAFSLPQNAQHRKYARWKAAYIHNCLKNGETPQPGPIGMEGESFGTCFPFLFEGAGSCVKVKWWYAQFFREHPSGTTSFPAQCCIHNGLPSSFSFSCCYFYWTLLCDWLI